MKNQKAKVYITIAIVLSIALAAALLVCTVGCAQGSADAYLRLHIRADSDAACDQQVKLAVRDAVVAYLTPLAGQCATKQAMREALAGRLADIERVADEVLMERGFGYMAHAYLGRERFPSRTYGDLTLAAGDYDALVVELGSGEGANWWCVAFPPLCFVAAEDTGEDGVVYRSVIAEWFRTHCKD